VVWAVILAAGESKRMGEPKLVLPFRGTTMVEAVVDKVLAAGPTRVVVVVGGAATEVRAALAGRPVQFVHNPDFAGGMLSSVQRGLRALPDEAEGALIVLADQPLVPEAAIRAVLEAGRTGAKGLVVPVFRGRRGHPLYIALSYRSEIEGLDPEVGLRQLLARHPDDILELEAGDPGLLEDVDTPADYRRVSGAGPKGRRPKA
jgi:molybdenum cofactor cytidylyltransferase